jgi:hypothetical protein
MLSEILGLELRYSWQQLEHLDRRRLEEAGFTATQQRSFGSGGPKAGVRLALSLGNHWTASLGVTSTGLLQREASPDSVRIVFRPTIFSVAAVGYAF